MTRPWPVEIAPRKGAEPDARFSLANERTFLAWTRTALAMVVGAVAVHTPMVRLPPISASVISLVLLAVALLLAIGGWTRWRAAEVAMRTGAPLPGFSTSLVIAAGTVSVVLAAGIGLLAAG